jgi:hypothetical protein
MAQHPSCGLVAQPTDSIDRLGFIAIRYRAWMGEALAQPGAAGNPVSVGVLRALSGSFDMIEHLAEDFLIESGERSADSVKWLASSVKDQAERMKRLLLAFGEAMRHRLVPSMEDLEVLCLACQTHVEKTCNQN